MHEGRFTHLLQPRAAVAPALVAQLGHLLSGDKSSLRTHSLMEHLYLEGSLCTLSPSHVNLVLNQIQAEP